MFPVLFSIIPWKLRGYSRIKRINSEIPRSSTAKNRAKNVTVARTVTV
jgi:hypothetical protein